MKHHTRRHAGHGTQDDHRVRSHGQHAGHSTAMFKDRFWLTLVLSVPVVYFSPLFGHLLGYVKMWQNLVWATGYNIIPVPRAAGVLAFAGSCSPRRRRGADVRLHHRCSPERTGPAPGETEPRPDSLTREAPDTPARSGPVPLNEAATLKQT